jgi:hypothetical protein
MGAKARHACRCAHKKECGALTASTCLGLVEQLPRPNAAAIQDAHHQYQSFASQKELQPYPTTASKPLGLQSEAPVKMSPVIQEHILSYYQNAL